jgi:predicted dehydrogenase
LAVQDRHLLSSSKANQSTNQAGMPPIRVGLFGAGYWGTNIGRVLNQTPGALLVACVDPMPEAHERVSRQYQQVRGYLSGDPVWDQVDAVALATPLPSHYALAREALSRGKHVFIEKPITETSAQADELVRLAADGGLVLMSGHTFAYSPAVHKVKEQIASGALGNLHYITLSRVNLGRFQRDTDVRWDLAAHDISLLLYWLDEMPVRAASFGRCCVGHEVSDVAFVWLQFPSGVVASIEVSWLSPQKMRRACVSGSRRMLIYDDIEPSEKIKIYDRGVELQQPQNFGEFLLNYRMGDMVAPYLGTVEPLAQELEHFIACIREQKRPVTDGAFGANVVRVLEMAMANQPLRLPTLAASTLR